MQMAPTTLERLRVFHAIATVGSVAGAARRLGYTPSAVSQHLGALEREAGAPLVERSRRGVVVTEAGRVLAARASIVLDLVRSAIDDVAASVGRLDATLSIAAFPSAISALVIPLLAELPATVRLTIVDAEPEQAIRALVAREVDCAITDHHSLDAAARDDLHRLPLRTEPVQLVTSSRRPKKLLADYCDTPWVLGGPDNRLATAARTACLAAGFAPNVIAQTDDHHVTFDIIRATGAVSFLPQLALRHVPDGIYIASKIAAPIERRIELVSRASMGSNALLQIVAASLVGSAA
jgi:DNA-binding transcriptional LysR family regulator